MLYFSILNSIKIRICLSLLNNLFHFIFIHQEQIYYIIYNLCNFS